MGQKAKSSTKKLFWNLNKTKMRVELSKKILLWRTSKSESPYVCNCKSGFNGHRCERISSSNYYSNDISAQPISAFVPAFSNGLQRPNSLSASQVKVTKNYKVNIFILAVFSKKGVCIKITPAMIFLHSQFQLLCKPFQLAFKGQIHCQHWR